MRLLTTTVHFVYVQNPFTEEADPPAGQASNSDSNAYQEVAAHSLEALSTAAAGNRAYDPVTTYQEYSNIYATHGGQSGYGPARDETLPDGSHNNIGFLLNPTAGTPSSVIDPNLEASVIEAAEQSAAAALSTSPQIQKDGTEAPDQAEEQVVAALRTFQDQLNQHAQ